MLREHQWHLTWSGKSGKVAEGPAGVNKAKTAGNYVPGGGTASYKCHVARRTESIGGTERRPVVHKAGGGANLAKKILFFILRSMGSH